MNENIGPDTIREWALIGYNQEILYIKMYALSSEESYLGQYEGVEYAVATSKFDYPVSVGMKWSNLEQRFI